MGKNNHRVARRARARRRRKERKGKRQAPAKRVPRIPHLCDHGACALAGRVAEWLIQSTGSAGDGLTLQRRCNLCKVELEAFVADNPGQGYEIEVTRIRG